MLTDIFNMTGGAIGLVKTIGNRSFIIAFDGNCCSFLVTGDQCGAEHHKLKTGKGGSIRYLIHATKDLLVILNVA